ncbi:MAG: NAD(P)-dependent oxidoreductase [Clostridia bacterium]|nr:NAD(P)-dependent oxidoreductase [Clostridia bacterium]
MWTEDKLNEMLTTPSAALIEDIKKIDGDIMILGAGGKMGPTLSLLAQNAVKAAGIDKKVIAVSRFTDEFATKLLTDNGVEIIKCDLQDSAQLNALPDVKNIIYMAGRKFGTNGNEWQTWGMNSVLPALVCEKFKNSSIVVFSSGNIYPLVPLNCGGSKETEPTGPIGEYATSCLARERSFEYAAKKFGTKVFMYRLSFAVDLRYGVLYDIAERLMNGEPISVTTPVFNIIWQGSANEIAIRGLLYASEDVEIMNVTGPEVLSVKAVAEELGALLGKEPIYCGEESDIAYFSNAGKMIDTFGYPDVPASTLIKWQAEWIKDGGRALGKPTHFEERGGKY